MAVRLKSQQRAAQGTGTARSQGRLQGHGTVDSPPIDSIAYPPTLPRKCRNERPLQQLRRARPGDNSGRGPTQPGPGKWGLGGTITTIGPPPSDLLLCSK